MNEHQEIESLLLLYVSGRLEPEQRARVEKHLAACASCRADLALWRGVADEIQAANRRVSAPAGLAGKALARIETQSPKASLPLPGYLNRAWQLLRSQVPLLRHEIWMVSALVFCLGYLASVFLRTAIGFQALVPLIATSGIAVLYGPEYDPNIEMALATTTSPRQILLVRLVLVFGYNLLLSLAVSLALLPVVPQLALGQLILAWLAPMTFLSGCALFLSLWIGPDVAISVTYLAWLTRIILGGSKVNPPVILPNFVQSLADMFRQFWNNPQALLALGVLIAAIAIFSAGFTNQRILRRG